MFRETSLAVTLALSVLAAPSSAGPAVHRGPPVVCHRLEIGDAPSLPFGEGAFGRDGSFDLSDLVEKTHALLESSDDTFVHMETLRRAVVYVTGGRPDGHKARKGDIDGLVGTLEKRMDGLRWAAAVATPEDEVAARRAWGLAAFDLAWTLEGLSEMGHKPRNSKQAGAWLQVAVSARPGDAALRLGASIVCFARGERQGQYVHLDRALAAIDSPSGLLGRNISNTMGSFLGTRDHAELATRVTTVLKGA